MLIKLLIRNYIKGLKFAHVNITSLPKHLDKLKLFLQQLGLHTIPFEILSLNETMK